MVGQPPETWPYRYYDAIADEQPNEICRLDVLSTAALHPGCSDHDLAFFYESSEALHRWLSAAPRDIDLWDADADVVDHVAQLAEFEGPGITLVSKVLHGRAPPRPSRRSPHPRLVPARYR